MKVSNSIPVPVLEAAQELARKRKMPFSRLCTRALNEYVTRHAPDLVTTQLDGIYASVASELDPLLLQVQASSLQE